MSKHEYRFMEVPNLADFDRSLGYNKPGFVAVCEETGVMVATDPEDGWQDNWEMPKEPIDRIPLALRLFCSMSPKGDGDDAPLVEHVLADQ